MAKPMVRKKVMGKQRRGEEKAGEENRYLYLPAATDRSLKCRWGPNHPATKPKVCQAIQSVCCMKCIGLLCKSW
jgi:hypothetical protein